MTKVCLTISSYRFDDSVAALLEKAAPLVPRVFSQVIVVDSLGTPRIPALIRERGWDFIEYHSADTNLGSAGNLARRLELAAATDANFAYALNHDGELSEEVVTRLVAAASRVEHVGAVYPLRALVNLGGRYDYTGTFRLLLPTRSSKEAPPTDLLDTYWGSSNGTLYSLEPIRQGLKPWADLWMGWEDLGYGWLLAKHGFRQVIVRDAVFADFYEFRELGSARLGAQVSQKPAWYSYYNARNLILIGKRIRPAWDVGASFACRIALECGTTALFRSQKRERFSLLARGVWDGLFGRTGQLR
jgi:GT2 family glycosyltransferase